MLDEGGRMELFIASHDRRGGSIPGGPIPLAAELASCLERFLEGTADEGTMSRSRSAVDAWRRIGALQGAAPA